MDYDDIKLFYSEPEILHLYIIMEKDQLAILFED